MDCVNFRDRCVIWVRPDCTGFPELLVLYVGDDDGGCSCGCASASCGCVSTFLILLCNFQRQQSVLSTSASAHVEFILAVWVWICSGLTFIGKQLLLMLGRVVVRNGQGGSGGRRRVSFQRHV